MSFRGAILHDDPHCAECDEVEGLGDELSDHGLVPFPSMEEDDGAASVVFTMTFWVEAMEGEFTLFRTLVHDRFRVLEEFFIADDGDG